MHRLASHPHRRHIRLRGWPLAGAEGTGDHDSGSVQRGPEGALPTHTRAHPPPYRREPGESGPAALHQQRPRHFLQTGRARRAGRGCCGECRAGPKRGRGGVRGPPSEGVAGEGELGQGEGPENSPEGQVAKRFPWHLGRKRVQPGGRRPHLRRGVRRPGDLHGMDGSGSARWQQEAGPGRRSVHQGGGARPGGRSRRTPAHAGFSRQGGREGGDSEPAPSG